MPPDHNSIVTQPCYPAIIPSLGATLTDPQLRFCLPQGQALRAALHHFRCPLCQDMQAFQAEMFRLGIKIPDRSAPTALPPHGPPPYDLPSHCTNLSLAPSHRDAAWEVEEGAFHDLYQRHSSCDTSLCLCPIGRDYSENTG